MSLRIVSLNIERSKHTESVLSFLSAQHPDVIVLQEICEIDIPLFEKTLGFTCEFSPMLLFAANTTEPAATVGTGILSRFPMSNRTTNYYVGDGNLVEGNFSSMEEKQKTIQHPVTTCDIAKDGDIYRIGVTHFPWTPDGSPSDFQRAAMKKLLPILSETKEFILCGDFNAPRGGEIFAELASRYTDNVPPEYVTSLDLTLHRAGKTRPEQLADKMVDGLFSTSGYRVSKVEMICGISDHCALVGEIEKVAS